MELSTAAIATLTNEAVKHISNKYSVSELEVLESLASGNQTVYSMIQDLVKSGLEAYWIENNK